MNGEGINYDILDFPSAELGMKLGGFMALSGVTILVSIRNVTATVSDRGEVEEEAAGEMEEEEAGEMEEEEAGKVEGNDCVDMTE